MLFFSVLHLSIILDMCTSCSNCFIFVGSRLYMHDEERVSKVWASELWDRRLARSFSFRQYLMLSISNSFLHFDYCQDYILYFCQCQKLIFHIYILAFQHHCPQIYLSILILINCPQHIFLSFGVLETNMGGDCMDFLGPVVYLIILGNWVHSGLGFLRSVLLGFCHYQEISLHSNFPHWQQC